MPRSGFTLVELLIVVFILGLLAAIALPQFSNATTTAKGSMLADNLRIFRTQVEVFKAQHGGVPPGYADLDRNTTPTEAQFISHMTMQSDAAGHTDPAAFVGSERYGPYFRSIPKNPLNDKNSVEVLENGATFPTAGDDSHGWIFQPSTLTFKADSAGADADGKAYIGY